MSYQLSRLDLVVNNATTQITVNTNPSTQSYINGDITPSDNIIDVASANNRFTNPDDIPAATIKSISKAASLTGLTATDTGIFTIPVSSPVAGNGLGKNLNINYDGGTYTQLLTGIGSDATNTTIKDLSDNNYTIVNNNVTINSEKPTAISGTAYSYNSLSFNGTSAYLFISTITPAIFNKDDFTIEFFIIAGTTQTSSLIDSFFSNKGQWKVGLDITTNTISFIYRNSANSDIVLTSTRSIVLGTWSHVALVKRDTGLTNNFTIYIDGIVSGSFSITDAIGSPAATGINIGKALASAQYYSGGLSNIRIVNKAIYTGAFTVPSANLTKTQSSASNTIDAIPSGSRINTKTATTTQAPLYVKQPLTIYNNLNYNAPTGQTEVYDNTLTINSYNAASSNINVISSTKTMNVADRPDFYITGSDAPNILGTSSSTITSSLGGSFNGTTSNITLNAANGGSLDLSTAVSWTVEGWFYPTSVTGSRSIFWKGGGGANPSYALWLNAATPQWIVGDGGVSGISQNLSDITINTWYHFALVRNNGFVTAYINGVGSTPVAITFTDPTVITTLWIGAAVDGRYFSGYISKFRVTKGIAIYTNNFTVQTSPLTSTFNTTIDSITGTQTSLLLSTTNDGNYLKDSSANNFTVTNTNDVAASSIGPTWTSGSTSSLSFNNSYLSIPTNSAFDFGLDDFTVECYFYLRSHDGINNPCLIVLQSGTAQCWSLVAKPGQIAASISTAAGTQASVSGSTSIVSLNNWYHVAYVRNGSNHYLYLNGSQISNKVYSPSSINTATTGLKIGAYNGSSGYTNYFDGYISNIRLVKGKAIYTNSFVPPNMPLTTTQNASTIAYPTSLLTLQSANIADNSPFANAMSAVAVSPIIPYASFLDSFSYNTPGATISTPGNPAYIRNTTKYNDPTQVGGHFNNFIPEHTGEEDKVQAWV